MLINSSYSLELSVFKKYAEIGQIEYAIEQLKNVKDKAVSSTQGYELFCLAIAKNLCAPS
jgi:hypothetical protein